MADMNWQICSFTTFADVTIAINGQVFRFEWSDRFGPLMLGKRGQPLANMLPTRSLFWKALHWWIKQGKRVENGRCLYEPVVPVITHWLRIDRRNLIQDTPENRAQYAAYLEPNASVVEIEESE